MNPFIPFSRQQQYLLPPSMNDWLPENHPARFIVEVVEKLDLSKGQSAGFPVAVRQRIASGNDAGLAGGRFSHRDFLQSED